MKRIRIFAFCMMIIPSINADKFQDTLEDNVRAELVAAVEARNPEVVAGILRRGVVTGLDKVQALMYATHKGYYDIVTLLLNDDVDLNAKNEFGKTALDIAIEQGDNTIIELLTQADATYSLENALALDDIGRINKSVKSASQKEKNQALINACSQGRMDLVRIMLNNGARVNTTGMSYEKVRTHPHHGPTKTIARGSTTPLIEAVRHDHADIVALLLKNNANINAKDSAGRSAITYATSERIKNMLRSAVKRK